MSEKKDAPKKGAGSQVDLPIDIELLLGREPLQTDAEEVEMLTKSIQILKIWLS
jgi:hypothetical protein